MSHSTHDCMIDGSKLLKIVDERSEFVLIIVAYDSFCRSSYFALEFLISCYVYIFESQRVNLNVIKHHFSSK